jgi:hypothetical protein
MVEPHGVNVDLMSVGVGHLKAQRWCAMNTHVADLGKRVLQLHDVIKANYQIEIVVGPCLRSEERVDSPTAIEPQRTPDCVKRATMATARSASMSD